MLNVQSLIKFPVPIGKLETNELSQKEINDLVYKRYDLTDAEISYIEDQILIS